MTLPSLNSYRGTSGTLLEPDVESLGDGLKGDHLVVSNFDLTQHIWLRLPLIGCDNAIVLFPIRPDFELFDNDISAVDSLGFEWFIYVFQYNVHVS